MPAPAAVRVHDDLPAGDPGIALGPADDKAPGGVDQVLGVLVEHVGRDDLADHMLDEEFANGGVFDVRGVLGGDDHILHLHRPVVLVADGDLGLGVGAQPADDPGLAKLGQFPPQPVRIHDRGRHHFGRLVAGVAEHQPLVAGALLGRLLALRRPRVHALGNVGRLAGEVVVDEHPVGVEHVVVVHVADVANGRAHHLLVIELRLRGDLAGDDHHVGFHHRFAGHAALRILLQAGVQHAVGDQVGHLVGMALAHGLGGENK